MNRRQQPTPRQVTAELESHIHFCSSCQKPFTNELARDRHVRYCTSKTRSRPRSCRACNAAKVKCSFGQPCSRCIKKAVDCVYVKTPAVHVRADLAPSADFYDGTETARDHTLIPSHTLTFPPVDEASIQFYMNSVGDKATGIHELDFLGSAFTQQSGLDLLPELDHASTHGDSIVNEKSAFEMEDWCTWAQHGISLAVVTAGSRRTANSSQMLNIRNVRNHAQCNADIIIQSWRAFPTMMLRRETLPWFIHRHSMDLKTMQDPSCPLPEAITNCMALAQLFASRTTDTIPFLWRSIEAEYTRLIGNTYHMDKHDTLAAVQACMMYLIMCIIDHSSENERHGHALLQALYVHWLGSMFFNAANNSKDFCMCFKTLSGGTLNDNELDTPSRTWEDWIFAESRRRLAGLWLLVGCVVCVKSGTPCDPAESYRNIPLPGPKSLWEASTPTAWKSEYEAGRILQVNGLVTMGDLVDLQRAEYTATNARKLDMWNAGVDNFGSLLNLVGSMV